MNREQLIEYLKEKTNISENDIRYIVNLKTTEINILRNRV
jgi:nucleoid DNA-binding protein